MCIVIEPLILNLYKHHLNFVRNKIKQIKSCIDYQQLLKDILYVGSSVMDIYVGEMGPEDLSSIILKIIGQGNYNNIIIYKKWLKNTNKEYRIIELPDNSRWVCRLGTEDKNRYIHIHPARYSPYTLRIKANTYKTAILILAKNQIEKTRTISDELIISVRCNDLKLSPIKSTLQLSELNNTIKILT